MEYQNKNSDILIIGGYGQVGRLMAERLAVLFPDRVVIAGRNLKKATSVAIVIGYGAKPRMFDIFSADYGSALNGVALVVCCVDQIDTQLVMRCLSLGIHYVDISANDDFFSQVEQLDDYAKANHATVMLSVGVAPGLSNMIAAQLIEQMEQVDRLDIVLEFGLGDQHGKAACEWMFKNFNVEYAIKENGQLSPVKSFSECLNISLQDKDGDRPAFRFNFPDQHVIGRMYAIPTVSTWLRFDSRMVTWFFAALTHSGLATLFRYHCFRSIAVWLVMHARIGQDTCVVAARAQGSMMGKPKTQTLTIIGRKEALMTAIMTVETVRQMVSKSFDPGVFHSFQVFSYREFLSALRRELPDLTVSL